jgi:hypothetical protein
MTCKCGATMTQGTGRGETKDSCCIMPVWYCESCDDLMVCSELDHFEEWLSELMVEYLSRHRSSTTQGEVWN